MTQPRDLTAEALRRGAAPGTGYVVARFLSQLFHPVILSIVGIFIIGLFAVPGRGLGLRWAALGALLQVIPPTIFFSIRLRQGAYTDEDISVRQQRNELYAFGLATVLFGIVMLRLFNAPSAFIALLCSAALLNVLSWLINFSWKISIHAASMGSCATIALLFSPALGVALWLCALALGWARVRTRNHTPLQVVAGLGLSAACVGGVFTLFGLV